jgi:hypothetical protein
MAHYLFWLFKDEFQTKRAAHEAPDHAFIRPTLAKYRSSLKPCFVLGEDLNIDFVGYPSITHNPDNEEISVVMHEPSRNWQADIWSKGSGGIWHHDLASAAWRRIQGISHAYE